MSRVVRETFLTINLTLLRKRSVVSSHLDVTNTYLRTDPTLAHHGSGGGDPSNQFLAKIPNTNLRHKINENISLNLKPEFRFTVHI